MHPGLKIFNTFGLQKIPLNLSRISRAFKNLETKIITTIHHYFEHNTER